MIQISNMYMEYMQITFFKNFSYNRFLPSPFSGTGNLTTEVFIEKHKKMANCPNSLFFNKLTASTRSFDYSTELFDSSTGFFDDSTELFDFSTGFFDDSTELFDFSTGFFDDSVEFFDCSTEFFDSNQNSRW